VGSGGAVFAYASSVLLADSVVEACSCGEHGCGVYFEGEEEGALTIRSTDFLRNGVDRMRSLVYIKSFADTQIVNSRVAETIAGEPAYSTAGIITLTSLTNVLIQDSDFVDNLARVVRGYQFFVGEFTIRGCAAPA